LKIIHKNCDPGLASDTSLPYTAYLIEYIENDEIKWDIAVSSKKVEIFDYYWDKYNNVQNMTQSQGKVNPKLWGYKKPEKKNKRGDDD